MLAITDSQEGLVQCRRPIGKAVQTCNSSGSAMCALTKLYIFLVEAGRSPNKANVTRWNTIKKICIFFPFAGECEPSTSLTPLSVCPLTSQVSRLWVVTGRWDHQWHLPQCGAGLQSPGPGRSCASRGPRQGLCQAAARRSLQGMSSASAGLGEEPSGSSSLIVILNNFLLFQGLKSRS